MPPPSADQSAIDFVRAGPDHNAVISASVVGYAMPAERPPTTRAAKSTVSDGAKPATSDAGIGQPHAEDDHELAAVAVAERAEPEHGGGEAERVADRDEVQRRLRRVERLADVGQRDVRDREVEVRDRGDQDQRDKHEARPLRCRPGLGRMLRGCAHPRLGLPRRSPSGSPLRPNFLRARVGETRGDCRPSPG